MIMNNETFPFIHLHLKQSKV